MDPGEEEVTPKKQTYMLANLASSQVKMMRFALANLKSLKIQNLQSGKFWNAPRLKNKRPPRAPTRNTLYKR